MVATASRRSPRAGRPPVGPRQKAARTAGPAEAEPPARRPRKAPASRSSASCRSTAARPRSSRPGRTSPDNEHPRKTHDEEKTGPSRRRPCRWHIYLPATSNAVNAIVARLLDQELAGFQRHVTLGDWDAVKAYLAKLPEDEAKAGYKQTPAIARQRRPMGGMRRQMMMPGMHPADDAVRGEEQVLPR